MPNPCRICADPIWDDQVGTWVRAGLPDREIARRLGINKSLVSRHRQRHVLKPMRHQLAIIGKGDEARRERDQLAAAAATDAPSTEALVAATLGLQAQVKKLAKIEERLERTAVIAETAGSPSGVAVIANQQLRAIETGSKLGATGGFAAPRAADQSAAGAKFSVNILFSATGETLSIRTATDAGEPTLEETDEP